MKSLTESSKRYITSIQQLGMLKDVKFSSVEDGYVATVTTNDGNVHTFKTSDEWNRWWDAKCPRVAVGFNPLA
jgi:hypothetical protein